MACVTLPDGCRIHYRDYAFADPRVERPTVVLLLGFGYYGDLWSMGRMRSGWNTHLTQSST